MKIIIGERLNSTVEEFCRINGIDIDTINNREDGIIQEPTQVNFIVARLGIEGATELRDVSIADIVGYDYEWRGIDNHIIESMSSFFDENGDPYHTRALGLLDLTCEDCMKKIDFKRERIKVQEMGDGKYVISNNGLHRYTVLRALYLSECARAGSDPEKLEELSKKYTIPVEVTTLDYFKTYSAFLLEKCNVRI